MRGAGTSIAGNAVGAGIVVDTVRHLNRIVEVDPEARTATVEPGVVHATLQRAAVGHGLRFGRTVHAHPLHDRRDDRQQRLRVRALGYGRTVDNVVALDAVFPEPPRPSGCRDRRRRPRHVRPLRPVLPAGERLLAEHLLPSGAAWTDPGRVGGTLALVREATVALVPDSRAPGGLGSDRWPGRPTRFRPCSPLFGGARLVASEGLDSRIVDLVRRHAGGVPSCRGFGLAVREGRRVRGGTTGRGGGGDRSDGRLGG